MINYIRRKWIKRAMKSLDANTEKYKTLDAMQFTIKILSNLRYGEMI